MLRNRWQCGVSVPGRVRLSSIAILSEAEERLMLARLVAGGVHGFGTRCAHALSGDSAVSTGPVYNSPTYYE